MGDREARTQDALVCGHTSVSEDAASRRPARPDGTSVIVNRALGALTKKRVVALWIAGALALVAVVYRSWVDAQFRTFVVLATTLHTPGLTWTAKALTADPRIDD